MYHVCVSAGSSCRGAVERRAQNPEAGANELTYFLPLMLATAFSPMDSKVHCFMAKT